MKSPTSPVKYICHLRPSSGKNHFGLLNQIISWKKKGIEWNNDNFFLSVYKLNDKENHSSDEDESCDSSEKPKKVYPKMIGSLYLGAADTNNFKFDFHDGTRFVLIANVGGN